MSSHKPTQHKKILLVDNEPDVTYAIQSVLEDHTRYTRDYSKVAVIPKMNDFVTSVTVQS